MTSIYSSGIYLYKRLLRYAQRYWFAFTLGIAGTMTESGITAGFTWVMKPLLDKGFVARDPHFIRWLPVGIVLAFIVRGVAGFMSNYYMAWAGRHVVMQFRQDMFSHLLRLPARFFDNTTSGHLLSTIIYNVEQVAKASTDALVTVVQESCFIIGLIIVMMTTSWELSLLFLVTIPAVAWIARRSSKRMRKLSTNVQSSMGEVTHVAEETIEGYKVIRTFGGEKYETEKFKNITEKNRFRELKIIATNTLASSGVQLIAGIVIAIMVFLTTIKTNITAGGFTSMIAAMLAMLKPMRNLTTVNNTIQKGIAAADSIFSLLDEQPEKDQGILRLTRAQGAIEYRNVEFSYQQDKTVLHQINFRAEPGQTIALVGRSGSGKTTLVNLLPRFYDEFSGTVLIDGVDTRTLKLEDLRNQFALVSQNVTLFNDTIAHNIAYGRLEEASIEEIRQAAKAAHALEFIEELPDGLNTLIGENGVLLSGGQRQRIAIARALLKNAPILILDEATSALDTESERHIQAALEELIHNRTTLVIAHRLSTVEKADKILVIDSGYLVEEGTHQELLALDGYYAKLYKMQFRDE
jgi:ATP-binding cassette, subfamily B, bacterial MsbA